MVKRRTRALFEFGVAAVGLLVQIRLWKAVQDDDEQDGRDDARVSPSGLALGGLYRMLDLWLRDRNVGGIGTNRRRGLLFGICTRGFRRRFLPQTEAFRANFDIGGTAGMVIYRFWYGVLRPLPGGDE